MAAEIFICLRCQASYSSDDVRATRVICPTCASATPSGAIHLTEPRAEQPTLNPNTSAERGTLPAPDHPPPSFDLPFLAPPQAEGELGRLGPYRVLGKLGTGGMGMVLLAEDQLLRRQIALKVMLPHAIMDPTDVARFIREARSQAAVEHEHVAAIHQVGEDRGIPFIAMPLLKGQTLASALKANPRVPLHEAVRICREVAEGLAAAHDIGLIHRDIKPANIWLEGERRKVKILDFGLARGGVQPQTQADGNGTEPMTRQGVVMGTPGYMSPEQAKAKPLDARSDLFSLGVVLYEMLAWQRPFQGDTPMELVVATASEKPTPISELNPSLPAPLVELTMQLLAKNPDERPATAKETALALKAVEAQLGVGALAPAAATVTLPSGQTDPWTNTDSGESLAVTHQPVAAPTRRWLVWVPWLVLGALVLFIVVVFLTRNVFIWVSPIGSPQPVPPDGEGGKQPGPDPKKEPATNFDPRAAAEWVLSQPGPEGAFVWVNDQQTPILEARDLPKVPFQLTGVRLRGNRNVPAAGFSHFDACNTLTFLDLGQTGLGDGVLKHFTSCDRLQNLSLDSSNVTDDGLANFKNCTDLRSFSVADVATVTDAGIAHLKDCKKLESVVLDRTQVADATLTQLKGCPNLALLTLRGTKVTAAAVNGLAKTSPNCRIEWDGGILGPKK